MTNSAEAATQIIERDNLLPHIPEIELEGVIGQGGMGVVYAGRQPYLDRKVAVKLLKTEAAGHEFVDRFRREAKTLANLNHPNVVACHQAGLTPGGDCYLAMEFIDGPNLQEWVSQNGPLNEVQALRVTSRIAAALEYALGRGVIHRDVKAENVLLKRASETQVLDLNFPFEAKLADLGLARPVQQGEESTRLTMAGAIMGTPATMAPEQFDDPDHVDFRADIYGLGCVLFQALSGKRPFAETKLMDLVRRKSQGEIPDPSELRDQLDPRVVELNRQLLAPKRESRPQSYAEIIQRCDQLSAALASGHRRAPARSWWIGGAAAALALLSVAGGFFFAASQQSGSAALDTAAATAAEPPAMAPSPSSPPAAANASNNANAASSSAAGQPDSTAPLAPVRVALAPSSTPLLSDDFFDRFAGWEPSADASAWFSEDEGSGVNGLGSGRRERLMPTAPWRIEGTFALLTNGSREAGVQVEAADGSGVAVSLKMLGGVYGSVSEVRPKGEGGIERRLAKFEPLEAAAMAEQVSFSLVVLNDRVQVLLDGESWGELPLRRPVERLALFVDDSTASYRDLLLREVTVTPER